MRFHAGASTRRVDVRVDVDPEDTVGALTAALAGHAGAGAGSAGVGLLRVGDDTMLDPEATVVDTGLVSGQTVTLVDVPRSTRAGPRRPSSATVKALSAARRGQALPGDLRTGRNVTLDVTSGPGVGRVVPLRRDVTVGRGETCTVTIDDPAMTREHFALQVMRDGRVLVVPNPAGTRDTRLGGELLDDARVVTPGQAIEAGTSTFVLRHAVAEETRRRDLLGQVPFNRVPYRRSVVRAQQLDDLAAPPELSTPGKLSLTAALMPMASSAGMAAMFGNMLFLLFSAATPVLLVFRHFGTKRGGKRAYRRAKAEFYESLDAAAARLAAALVHEQQARRVAAPDLAELARQAMLHMPRLWERNRDAGDLLSLRLGLGTRPSHINLTITPGGDPVLRDEATARLAHQAAVADVPITIDLVELGTAGLWGHPDQVAATGRALVAQAACLHSPEDLVVAAASGEASADGHEWLKWLPHVRSATSPLDGPHLAVGADDTRSLIVNLLAVAADRAERAGSSRSSQGAAVWPRVLCLIDEAAEPDRSLLSQLLDIAPGYGIHVLWLGESELQVPRQCNAVVACRGGGSRGQVRFTDPDRDGLVVELDRTDPETARSIARSLAPLRDASASSPTTAIPKVVPLFDVVELDPPSPEAVAERWGADRGYSLELPVGVSPEGPFTLDLVEQGPHTLIGGTSGSGKSELLQTLVLGLAANYPPSKLTFLFVDYKGGASSAEFRDLPHTVGYVTNLDGRMAMRALTSLRAELQRRMTLMEGRAKDLRELLAVAPDEAPPSLIIVVDEFAVLAKEIPDFVTGIIDIAQRGRSLGVHLVLATQRPAGVVNENILANTNLRIALRVLDPADSVGIVGSRDAADIPVPLRGRGYARTGPHALIPFQCAWSGAPAHVADAADDPAARVVGVVPFTADADADGLDTAGGEGEGAAADVDAADASTQLDVLVDACAGAAEQLRLAAPRRPWLEPLPEVLTLAEALARAPADALHGDPGRMAVLGLSDDPENQAQHVAAIDLEATGGLIVFGTGGSGKTTLLRSLALGLARQGTADQVQLYALDFASRALGGLGELPHCAAVVAGDDVEQVCRLLTLLDRQIESRRDTLAAAAAENLGALRHQTGETNFPRIVLLVDGYSGFHATFDRADRFGWLARFQRIVSAGRQVGVHVVLTNDRRMGVPPPLLSAIGARLVLRMSTPEELSALGVPAKVARDSELPAGRGFLDGTVEVQVACVSDSPVAMAQSQAIATEARRLAATAEARAPALPALPPQVDWSRLAPARTPTSDDGSAREPLDVPLAVADLTLGTVTADLRRQNMVVLGPPLSGTSTTLATVAVGLRTLLAGAATSSTGGFDAADTELRLCVLGTPGSPLRHLDVWDDAAFTREAHGEVAERVADLIVGEDGLTARAVVFVDAAEDVEAAAALQHLEALSKHGAVRLVVAAEATTLSKAYSGWLSNLRRNRAALMLQPENVTDIEVNLGVKPDLRPGQEFPPGRGIFVANRRWQLVQVAVAPAVPAPPPVRSPISSTPSTTSN